MYSLSTTLVYSRNLDGQAPQGFDLKSMLCLPMQRMLKYPLLLGDLRKSTPPTHPEYGPLGHALEAIQELARCGSLLCTHHFLCVLPLLHIGSLHETVPHTAALKWFRHDTKGTSTSRLVTGRT
jgi:hypothetical protein